MPNLEAGIPVHPLSEAEAGQPGFQDIKGQLKFDEIAEFVDKRKKINEPANSHLEVGQYLLLWGKLRIYLNADERLIKSLEEAVNGNGYTEGGAAGMDLLYALNLIHL